MNHVSDQTKKDDNEANIQSQEKVSAVKYVTNLLSYQFERCKFSNRSIMMLFLVKGSDSRRYGSSQRRTQNYHRRKG